LSLAQGQGQQQQQQQQQQHTNGNDSNNNDYHHAKECIDYLKYQLFSELSSLSILLSRNQLNLARKMSREISPCEV
jgi:hypothetical protein